MWPVKNWWKMIFSKKSFARFVLQSECCNFNPQPCPGPQAWTSVDFLLTPLPLCCCWMMPYFISLYCSMTEIKVDALSLRFQMQLNCCRIHWIWKEKCNPSVTFHSFVLQYCNVSMTSLLTHTVAYSTKLSNLSREHLKLLSRCIFCIFVF